MSAIVSPFTEGFRYTISYLTLFLVNNRKMMQSYVFCEILHNAVLLTAKLYA